MAIERPTDSTVTATGRKLKVDNIEGTSLYRIRYADGTQGRVPDKYAGNYTSIHLAEHALKTFVDETFKVAEDHIKKKSA